MLDFAVLPFALFCLIATGTPGPNNMINLAQGVRLGFWRAFPFALGTGLGIASLLIAVSLGLGVAFRELPALQLVMKAVTLLFLLYLAWMIANSGPLKTDGDSRRIGFLGGVGFQWINPKTWAAAMTMATTYLPANPSLATALSAGAIFCAIGWTTQPVWIGFGTALRGFLSDPARARAFNVVMAGLLLAATLPVLLG